MLTAPKLCAQGPPYQTDDPTPVDYKHYEAYIFGGVDGTPVEYDTLGPAFEFDWGRSPEFNSTRFCLSGPSSRRIIPSTLPAEPALAPLALQTWNWA